MSEEMKALREQLLRNDKNGYDTLDEAQLAEMEAYCADYKAFLNAGKTERLSARAAIAAAEAVVALSIIMVVYRNYRTVDADAPKELKG